MTNTNRSRRRYSDDYRGSALAALDANGGNLRQTSQQLGIPNSTLEGWAKGIRNPVDPDLRTQKKGELTLAIEDMALRLAHVIDEKAEQMNPRDAAVSLGIAVDKLLLLRGQPNSINEDKKSTTTDELDRMTDDELSEHIARLRARRSAPGGGGVGATVSANGSGNHAG